LNIEAYLNIVKNYETYAGLMKIRKRIVCVQKI